MRVLLVVDMQKGFLTKDKYIALAERLDKYFLQQSYDKIIFTKYINDVSKNNLYQTRIGWNKLTTKAEQELCFANTGKAIVLEKYGYGLEQKDLEYIKSLNINQIDVCGLKAEACVYAVSLQLWDLGIYPNILINYVEGDVSMKEVYIKQFGDVDTVA